MELGGVRRTGLPMTEGAHGARSMRKRRGASSRSPSVPMGPQEARWAAPKAPGSPDLCDLWVRASTIAPRLRYVSVGPAHVGPAHGVNAGRDPPDMAPTCRRVTRERSMCGGPQLHMWAPMTRETSSDRPGSTHRSSCQRPPYPRVRVAPRRRGTACLGWRLRGARVHDFSGEDEVGFTPGLRNYFISHILSPPAT